MYIQERKQTGLEGKGRRVDGDSVGIWKMFLMSSTRETSLQV